MNWLEVLITRVLELIPWTRVKPWQRAVRTTYVPFKGVRVRVIEPGIGRHVWFFDEYEIRDVQEDTDNLLTQSVTTKDDVAVTFSANFAYEIEDVLAAVMNVKEFSSGLRDVGMMHLAERAREMTWAELRDGQKEMEKSLRGTLTTRAKSWGVKITRVGLTDLVKARQFRHFGEIQQ